MGSSIRRLGVGTDLSGTLVDCGKLTDTYGRDYFGVPKDLPVDYSTVVEGLGLTDRAGWTEFKRWLYTGHFQDAPWVPGARETLRMLRDEGISYCVVSTKPPMFLSGAARLFESAGLDVPAMYFIGSQPDLPMTFSKGRVCAWYGLDVLIDNSKENLDTAPYVPYRILLSHERSPRQGIRSVPDHATLQRELLRIAR